MPTQRYHVYVIQIRRRCADCKRRRKPGMRCCVYVGATSKTPEARLQQHLDPPPKFRKTVVTKCGGSLRPDLSPKRTYKTWEDATRAEADLAERLRLRGYTVFGGH